MTKIDFTQGEGKKKFNEYLVRTHNKVWTIIWEETEKFTKKNKIDNIDNDAQSVSLMLNVIKSVISEGILTFGGNIPTRDRLVITMVTHILNDYARHRDRKKKIPKPTGNSPPCRQEERKNEKEK